jgi:hypothetical protein
VSLEAPLFSFLTRAVLPSGAAGQRRSHGDEKGRSNRSMRPLLKWKYAAHRDADRLHAGAPEASP